jgi:hypothetical protein
MTSRAGMAATPCGNVRLVFAYGSIAFLAANRVEDNGFLTGRNMQHATYSVPVSQTDAPINWLGAVTLKEKAGPLDLDPA